MCCTCCCRALLLTWQGCHARLQRRVRPWTSSPLRRPLQSGSLLPGGLPPLAPLRGRCCLVRAHAARAAVLQRGADRRMPRLRAGRQHGHVGRAGQQ